MKSLKAMDKEKIRELAKATGEIIRNMMEPLHPGYKYYSPEIKITAAQWDGLLAALGEGNYIKLIETRRTINGVDVARGQLMVKEEFFPITESYFEKKN